MHKQIGAVMNKLILFSLTSLILTFTVQKAYSCKVQLVYLSHDEAPRSPFYGQIWVGLKIKDQIELDLIKKGYEIVKESNRKIILNATYLVSESISPLLHVDEGTFENPEELPYVHGSLLIKSGSKNSHEQIIRSIDHGDEIVHPARRENGQMLISLGKVVPKARSLDICH